MVAWALSHEVMFYVIADGELRGFLEAARVSLVVQFFEGLCDLVAKRFCFARVGCLCRNVYGPLAEDCR